MGVDSKERWNRAKRKYDELSRTISAAKGKEEAVREALKVSEEEIKKLTKLQDLSGLDAFVDRLDKEINLKETMLAEKISELEGVVREMGDVG
jgi:predicted  nucleic acid-binding Zn-ribbon protein